MLKTMRGIFCIGIIEILIGGITLLATAASFLIGINAKPANVMFFVTTAACVSTALGFGILKTQKWAYQLLLYFSSVIFLSKILIFMDIIHLNGALVSSVPRWLNNIVSLGYHGWIIVYFQKPKVKKLFHL